MKFIEKETYTITFDKDMSARIREHNAQMSEDRTDKTMSGHDAIERKKPFFGWLYLLITAAGIFLWYFLKSSHLFEYVIFTIIGATLIAFFISLATYLRRKKRDVPSNDASGLDSQENISHLCHEWYETIKGECVQLRSHDGVWGDGVFLQCILVECKTDLLQMDQMVTVGDKIELVREYGHPDDKNAIVVTLENGTRIGYVCRSSNAIPAGLMNSGMKLISRVYQKKLFPYIFCIVAEIYINDHMPTEELA